MGRPYREGFPVVVGGAYLRMSLEIDHSTISFRTIGGIVRQGLAARVRSRFAPMVATSGVLHFEDEEVAQRALKDIAYTIIRCNIDVGIPWDEAIGEYPIGPVITVWEVRIPVDTWKDCHRFDSLDATLSYMDEMFEKCAEIRDLGSKEGFESFKSLVSSLKPGQSAGYLDWSVECFRTPRGLFEDEHAVPFSSRLVWLLTHPDGK